MFAWLKKYLYRKTVASIVAPIQSVIEALESHVEVQRDAVTGHDAAIDAATFAKWAALDEAQKASAAAAKFKALLS
jgi:hypothetical protein